MDQIEEVRNKVDIVELISEYLPLKKSGRSFRAPCPFHSETKPSFFVSPELQIFKCFGCNKAGSIFNFLMEIEGMSFGEALRILAKRAGVKLTAYRPTGEEKQRDLLLEINHLASEYYHYLLLSHPVGNRAREYLKKRKIWSSSIKLFRLGYAPEAWEGLINYLVTKKGYRIEDLEKAGLVIKSDKSVVQGRIGYYDRFRGRLIFPLHDHRKNVSGLAGRVIVDREETPKYINTPETPIYHKSDLLYGLEVTKEPIRKKNLAIITEGETDVISSYQAGVKNVVAIKGSALTEEQVRLLGRFCENIALALDVDLAGDAAAKRGIEMAEQAGLNIRVIKPLYGKDADECVRKSTQLWKDSVKKTVSIWDFYINSAFEKHGGKTAESKKKIGQEIIPIFSRISNQIVKAHYVKVLAQKLGVSEEVILQEMAKVKKQAFLKSPAPSTMLDSDKGKSRRQVLEEYLLALVLQAKSPPKIKLKIKTPIIKKIFAKLAKVKRFSLKSFYKSLPDELKETASQSYLRELGKVEIKKEIEKTSREIERLDLREKLSDLAAKKDFQKFNQLSKKLKSLE